MLALLMAGASTASEDFPITYLFANIVIGAAVGALIGNWRNRMGLGIVLGALLGCIGWLIVAVLPKKLPKY
jgi:hypothetical protein